MKLIRALFTLLALATLAHAADTKVSDLTLETSPSTNTFVLLSDMNIPASKKYLFTNLFSQGQASGIYIGAIAESYWGPSASDAVISFHGPSDDTINQVFIGTGDNTSQSTVTNIAYALLQGDRSGPRFVWRFLSDTNFQGSVPSSGFDGAAAPANNEAWMRLVNNGTNLFSVTNNGDIFAFGDWRTNWPSGGGDVIWTNANQLTSTTDTNSAILTSFWMSEDWSTYNAAALDVEIHSTNQEFGSSGLIINYNGTTNDIAFALDVNMRQPSTTGGVDLRNQNAVYGIFGSANSAGDTNGAIVGVCGLVQGRSDLQFGVIGIGVPNEDRIQSAGVYGVTRANTVPAIGAGVVGVIYKSSLTAVPNLESAAGLFDAFDTGLPIIVGRTNNGTRVFSVENDGSISAGATNQWKLGAYATNTVTLITTNYVTVTIDGVDYKLAIVR